MYVERSFSNNYGDARYYSVVLNEDELSLYSDLHENLYFDSNEWNKEYRDWYKDSDKKKVLPIAGGIGAAGAALGAYRGGKSEEARISKIIKDKGEKSLFKTDPAAYKKYLDPKVQKSLKRKGMINNGLGAGAVSLGAGFLAAYAIDRHNKKKKKH